MNIEPEIKVLQEDFINLLTNKEHRYQFAIDVAILTIKQNEKGLNYVTFDVDSHIQNMNEYEKENIFTRDFINQNNLLDNYLNQLAIYNHTEHTPLNEIDMHKIATQTVIEGFQESLIKSLKQNEFGRFDLSQYFKLYQSSLAFEHSTNTLPEHLSNIDTKTIKKIAKMTTNEWLNSIHENFGLDFQNPYITVGSAIRYVFENQVVNLLDCSPSNIANDMNNLDAPLGKAIETIIQSNEEVDFLTDEQRVDLLETIYDYNDYSDYIDNPIIRLLAQNNVTLSKLADKKFHEENKEFLNKIGFISGLLAGNNSTISYEMTMNFAEQLMLNGMRELSKIKQGFSENKYNFTNEFLSSDILSQTAFQINLNDHVNYWIPLTSLYVENKKAEQEDLQLDCLNANYIYQINEDNPKMFVLNKNLTKINNNFLDNNIGLVFYDMDSPQLMYEIHNNNKIKNGSNKLK